MTPLCMLVAFEKCIFPALNFSYKIVTNKPKLLEERPMKSVVRSAVVIILTALSIIACSNAPEAKRDPYNDADSQKTRAHQTQDELSSETSR